MFDLDEDDYNYTMETISSSVYGVRTYWEGGYLYSNDTHWYYLDADYASSSIYIHWQDAYNREYDHNYSAPSADIKVSVYAANKITALTSVQDSGYSPDYSLHGPDDGLWVYGATGYWIKVEACGSSSGTYYLCAVEDPI